MFKTFADQNTKEHTEIIDTLRGYGERITKLEKAKWYGQGVISVLLFMVTALFIPMLLGWIQHLINKI